VHFASPLDGFPLGIGEGVVKNGIMGLPEGSKSFKIGLAV